MLAELPVKSGLRSYGGLQMNETEKEHMIQLGKQAKETVKPIIEKQLIKDGINIE